MGRNRATHRRVPIEILGRTPWPKPRLPGLGGSKIWATLKWDRWACSRPELSREISRKLLINSSVAAREESKYSMSLVSDWSTPLGSLASFSAAEVTNNLAALTGCNKSWLAAAINRLRLACTACSSSSTLARNLFSFCRVSFSLVRAWVRLVTRSSKCCFDSSSWASTRW